MQKKEELNCQVCPVGKVIGQRECPGTKLKLRILEWFKRGLSRRQKEGKLPSN